MNKINRNVDGRELKRTGLILLARKEILIKVVIKSPPNI